MYLYPIFAACLVLVSCKTDKAGEQPLEVIPVGTAFDNRGDELKASDCFRKIRYVALETTDSCLVGNNVSVQILNDWIVMYSGKDRCQLFDKKTGRFIRSIGHSGDDPEAYSTVHGGWADPYTEKLIFPGHGTGNMVIYRADGLFDDIWKPAVTPTAFPAVTVFDYCDSEQTVGYYPATDSLPARMIFFRAGEVAGEHAFRQNGTGDRAIGPDEIESISVLKSGRSMFSLTRDKKGNTYVTPLGNCYFWHYDDRLCFHQPYNDTLYAVSADRQLQPTKRVDLGTYGLAYEKRFEEKKDGIFLSDFMENKEIILFHFITNHFADTYNAFYRKADKTVKVAPYDKKFTDDINGFLPLQPLSVSSAGEFAAFLSADEIVSWFEENAGRENVPEEVAALKKVKEEDNPVIAIME